MQFSDPIDDLPLIYRSRALIGQAKGLVILLHGVGSNENAMVSLASAMPAHLQVVLVRSPLVMGPHAYGYFRVNFTKTGPVIDAVAAETSRQQLKYFVEQLQLKIGLTPSQTVIAGFSQGGIMSAGLSLTEPSLVRGFGILCGRILPEIAPLIARGEALKKLSALVIHGTQDSTLPIEWADKSVACLQSLGVPLEDKRYQAQHELTPLMIKDVVSWVKTILDA
jgi:phospholipase/carboxylesterase